MIHFFEVSGKSHTNSPFGNELVRLGIEHRFIGFPVELRYRTRAGLLLRVYPRLLWASAKAAFHSLVLSKQKPDVVVIGTDIMTLVIWTFALLLRQRPLIVFQSLILTPKRSPFAALVQRALYTLVLNMVDLAICHSRVEVSKYKAAFPKAKCAFFFIPYGTTVSRRKDLIAAASERSPRTPANLVIASAGRSGRDYRTLVKSTRGLPCDIHIVCDTEEPVYGLGDEHRVTVFRNLYNEDYLRVLAEADIVVVPLSADDVSAGQMVLLQSFALRKPVVMTRTSTTVDYMDDGVEGFMVGIGKTDEMRSAIVRLLDNCKLREEFGAKAERRFQSDFVTEVFVGRLISAINEARGRRTRNKSG
jgi:glycosyltransferase involved in cell wall biosynthesis